MQEGKEECLMMTMVLKFHIYLFLDPSRLKIQKFLPKRTGSSSSYSMEMSNDFWKDDLSGVSYGSKWLSLKRLTYNIGVPDIFNAEFKYNAAKNRDLINFEK